MNDLNECCPRFIPSRWDGKDFHWNHKHFIKDTMPTLFHVPFPPVIGSKISKMWKLVTEAHAAQDNLQDTLVLFSDPSPFKSEIYISVEKEVEGARNVDFSGDYEAKVFDGDYNAIPFFIKEMNSYLAAKNEKAEDYFIHYAYCPKCMKKYGHNYMILFAKVSA